jgi:diacylglycerol kinase family enzyme
MLVVGNTRNYAGVVEITREAQVDDGLLDVCVSREGRWTSSCMSETCSAATFGRRR